jgi:hypothetical protein
MEHNARRIQIKKVHHGEGVDSDQNWMYNVLGDNGESLSHSESLVHKSHITEIRDKYYPEWPIEDITEPQEGTKEIKVPADNPEEFLNETSHEGNEAGPEE